MAVVNHCITEDVLRQMAQSQLQEYARQQMALGMHGATGLGGITGQQYQNPYAYSNSLCGFSHQTAYTPSHPKPEPVKVEPPENGVHDHLQRRVNKWLKGVELPLH